MSRGDRAVVLALMGLAAFLLSRGGQGDGPDRWTALTGFPLFLWLGWPFRLRASGSLLVAGPAMAGAALLAAGLFLDSDLALAAGWTALALAWLYARLVDEGDRARALARFPLLLLAFPWLAGEGQTLGWWFRLTGAWSVEHLFALTGLEVARSGVLLSVQHLSVSVDAPCAGLNFLQAVLLAGVTLAALRQRLESPRDTVRALPLLFGLAWLANTLRIVVLCVVALTFGASTAKGAFHEWGGLGVLALMFLLCHACFARPTTPETAATPAV